ncbi:pyridoxal-phosphate dependent enzyme [Aquimarina sp. RZ0]|uniref:pyridoxal-phosphate dependent enzyme n=1 Tax=Aquimarina sp. RZ0 TaxID=2607730 RepID=UPI0011F3C678|nr:pyridoxal-phosphate dependent enzyme [Aquimarina sp. RZ0]
MEEETRYFPALEDIQKATSVIKEVSMVTPLMNSLRYSTKYKADILLKREDLQRVRSFKIRGAFNKISSLSKKELAKGVVCVIAGNHAQGVAFACQQLGIDGSFSFTC